MGWSRIQSRRLSLMEWTTIVDQMDARVMISGLFDRFFMVNKTFFRKVEIEHDVIQTTNGSARVRIGATEILVGVKEKVLFYFSKGNLHTIDVY